MDTPTPPSKYSYTLHATRRLAACLIVVCAAAFALYIVGAKLIDKWNDGPGFDVYSTLSENAADGGSCSIAVIPLAGDLYTTSANAIANGESGDSSSTALADDIVSQINQAKSDDSISGVVLQIDSLGGSPVAGEMIADALRSLGKPSVALIRESGDSAAYLAASGATRIIASPYSDVGDIGVTGSYVDYSKEDAMKGEQFQQISAGTYKDAGNPEKSLTDAEKALLQRNVDDAYQTFVTEVARNRSLATSTVAALANGSSMTGTRALGTGLIDELGNIDTAQTWLKKTLPDQDVTMCSS